MSAFPFSVCSVNVLKSGRGWSAVNTHLKKGAGIVSVRLVSKAFVNAGVCRTHNYSMNQARR